MAGYIEYEELVRIGNPIEADLLAAFLADGDLEFQMLNRTGAGIMSQLIASGDNPVIFKIQSSDGEKGRQLLDEYRVLQEAELPIAEET